MSYGVGCRCRWDAALLWLWHRPVAVALIRPLAWESPYAVGTALKRQKKKKKKKKEKKRKKEKKKSRLGHFPLFKTGIAIRTTNYPPYLSIMPQRPQTKRCTNISFLWVISMLVFDSMYSLSFFYSFLICVLFEFVTVHC